MNKWLEILVGLVLIVAAVYLWMATALGTSALEFLKGGIMWLIILLGILFLMLGISDLKD
jgi:hypothetical protein